MQNSATRKEVVRKHVHTDLQPACASYREFLFIKHFKKGALFILLDRRVPRDQWSDNVSLLVV